MSVRAFPRQHQYHSLFAMSGIGWCERGIITVSHHPSVCLPSVYMMSLHMIKSPRPSPSIFVCCDWNRRTNWTERTEFRGRTLKGREYMWADWTWCQQWHTSSGNSFQAFPPLFVLQATIAGCGGLGTKLHMCYIPYSQMLSSNCSGKLLLCVQCSKPDNVPWNSHTTRFIVQNEGNSTTVFIVRHERKPSNEITSRSHPEWRVHLMHCATTRLGAVRIVVCHYGTTIVTNHDQNWRCRRPGNKTSNSSIGFAAAYVIVRAHCTQTCWSVRNSVE